MLMKVVKGNPMAGNAFGKGVFFLDASPFWERRLW